VAQALDYAHSKGVIHRDVKPANIMLCEDGCAKLMDFGIAKLADELLQYSSEMTGSPQFMSPEQLKGDIVTPKSDQYGLAAIAYWLLTGAHTFSANSLAQLSYRVLFEPVTPAHVHNPQLDIVVHDVLRKALSKQADDRFLNCEHFVSELERQLLTPTPVTTQSHRLPVVEVPKRQSIFTRNPFWSGFCFALLLVAAVFLFWQKFAR
jgi:serine/threonine protein kinase